MKKLALVAALALGLSACSNVTKTQIVNKEQLIGTWVCVIKYDDIKVTTLDVSEFQVNGDIRNSGQVSDEQFSPVKFKYITADQGRWDLKGNQLIIDYDLMKRKVVKATPESFLSLLKQDARKSIKEAQLLLEHEQKFFEILSDTTAKNSKITLDIVKFGNSHMSIQQDMGNKVYIGSCVTEDKANEYIEALEK